MLVENQWCGILLVPDLAALGKMQQMNLTYAVDRLEKLNLQLIAATVVPLPTLGESGWDSKLLAKLGEVCTCLLAGHADELPEIASLLLTNFIERGEVQPRRFSTGALNTLRTLPWKKPAGASWTDLYVLVRNLALTALDEEISAEDVTRVMPQETGCGPELVPLLPLFDQAFA